MRSCPDGGGRWGTRFLWANGKARPQLKSQERFENRTLSTPATALPDPLPHPRCPLSFLLLASCASLRLCPEQFLGWKGLFPQGNGSPAQAAAQGPLSAPTPPWDTHCVQTLHLLSWVPSQLGRVVQGRGSACPGGRRIRPLGQFGVLIPLSQHHLAQLVWKVAISARFGEMLPGSSGCLSPSLGSPDLGDAQLFLRRVRGDRDSREGRDGHHRAQPRISCTYPTPKVQSLARRLSPPPCVVLGPIPEHPPSQPGPRWRGARREVVQPLV